LTCDIDRATNQIVSLVKRAELAANHGQPTQGAEMPGLIGENPSIGLFGCVQGVSANRDCGINAPPVGKS